MKKLDFMEALNHLRDGTIAEAEEKRAIKAPARKRGRRVKFAALAACAALAVFAGVYIGRNRGLPIEPRPTEPAVTAAPDMSVAVSEEIGAPITEPDVIEPEVTTASQTDIQPIVSTNDQKDEPEKAINGLDYILNYKGEPSYNYNNMTKNPATGGAQSYDELMSYYIGDEMKLIAYEITKVYTYDEALEFSAEFYDWNTLYHAHAFYDLLNDCEVNYDFDIVENGSETAQWEGRPVYAVGDRLISLLPPEDEVIKVRGYTYARLSFALYNINGTDIAYKIGDGKYKLEGGYPNLDLEMDDRERKVVTTTLNNPVNYTQKSTLRSLIDFFRGDFIRRGYIKNTSDLAKLVITLESAGMGFEGYSVDSADEITDGNPWQELNITSGTTLPVYARKMERVIEDNGMIHGYDVDYMREQLTFYAGNMGFDMDDLVIEDDGLSEEAIKKTRELMESYDQTLADDYGKPERLWCEQDGIKIEINVIALKYWVDIDFENGYGLPDGAKIGYYYDGTYEQAEKAAEWLLPQYEWMIGNNDAATVEIVANDNYYVAFYHSLINGGFLPYETEDGTLIEYAVPEEKIVQTILNYNFNRIEFRDDQIWIFTLDSYDKLGDYPIITPEQALERVGEGRFMTTSPDTSKKSSDVEKIDLIYRDDGIPYYRCFVAIGVQHGGATEKIYTPYYVPAIADEYIDGSTPWDGSFNG